MATRQGWHHGGSSEVLVIFKLMSWDGAATNEIVRICDVSPLRLNNVHEILQSLFELDYLGSDDGGDSRQCPGGVPLSRHKSYLVHDTLEQGSSHLIVRDPLEIES